MRTRSRLRAALRPKPSSCTPESQSPRHSTKAAHKPAIGSNSFVHADDGITCSADRPATYGQCQQCSEVNPAQWWPPPTRVRGGRPTSLQRRTRILNGGSQQKEDVRQASAQVCHIVICATVGAVEGSVGVAGRRSYGRGWRTPARPRAVSDRRNASEPVPPSSEATSRRGLHVAPLH
jgi:hypothetical protein